jgi:dynein heavy chain
MVFLGDKRKGIESSVTRLEGGLATLAKATDDTAVLQEELAVQDADIADKKAVVEEMIKNIKEKSAIAGKQEAECTEKKAFLEVQNKEIDQKKAEADAALAAAEPVIQKAQEALNEISPKDLTELKGFNQVVPAVLKLVQITFYLYVDARSDDAWANIKTKMLGEMGLL